ncbi:MAG: PPC domain-containing protein [Oculatellaceae cyanobacterium Prado106]|jgi:hypothetical protein|nr:PPC domain-containing protein [Oculatellaceae cyanobacterium Prado106]
MLSNFLGNAIATRKSDNSQNSARPIGQLTGTRRFRGAVGVNDKTDFYSFTLSGRSSFNLSLNKLKNNVDVFLQRGNQVVGRSTKGGKKSEAISTTLEAGTYFVRVQQKSGNSKYRLTLSATASDSGGTTPPPPSPPGQSRYLTQALFAGSRILRLDTATGRTSVLATDRNTSFFDDYLEIASFGNELFVSKGVVQPFTLGGIGRGLYRIDPTTGAESFVGDFGVKKINSDENNALDAMAFTSSGELYGVFNNAIREGDSSITAKFFPAFYSIDKNTGKATFIARLPETRLFDGIDDIAFDPNSGRFLASLYRGDGRFGKLLSISLAGDVQDLGFLPETRLTGMFFQNGSLTGFTGERQVAIDINRKKIIGEGPLQVEVFESTDLPFTKPDNETAGFTGAG